MQTANTELFPFDESIEIVPGAFFLGGFARTQAAELFSAVREVWTSTPPRIMHTPGGHRMSVAMTNCGELGWVSDKTGYRYTRINPFSGNPWPDMPEILRRIARTASAAAGFYDFDPDVCLINRYEPGARMSLHQDRNEHDFRWPIVSVSLGLPGIFQFGGMRRAARPQRIPLEHGDVVVWGGPARLRYHGILTLKDGCHPLTGAMRINLTFRRAG